MAVVQRLNVMWSVVLAMLVATTAAVARPLDNTFCRTVLEHFETWDTDKNGELGELELDRLSMDDAVTGAAAAAVGTLKSFERNQSVKLPALTKGYFEERSTSIQAGGRPKPEFEDRFSRTMRRIERVRRNVFGDAGPTLESCRQGHLGTCYFISMVGAMAHRDPNDIRKMITENPDGSYTVKFEGHEPVKVAKLTDASMALTSSAGYDGVWLAILEKAYGAIRNRTLPESLQRLETTDAIAGGGSVSPVIRVLTGHSTDRMTFRDHKDNPDRQTEMVERLRKTLKDAMSEKKLVATATGGDGFARGMDERHSYAVIAYDAATDRATVWNPHGNRYRPRGDPGPQNGYTTRNGIFEIPLDEFVQVFTGVTVETSEVSERGRSGSRRRG